MRTLADNNTHEETDGIRWGREETKQGNAQNTTLAQDRWLSTVNGNGHDWNALGPNLEQDAWQ